MAAVVERVEAAVTFALRHEVLGRGTTPGDLAGPDDVDPDSAHFAVRDPDRRVVGTGTVRRLPCPTAPDEPGWQVRGMTVTPPARGQGLGSAVLRAILDHVAQRGGGVVWCHGRIAAVTLYERHGFVRHGEPFVDPIAGTQVFLARRVEPA